MTTLPAHASPALTAAQDHTDFPDLDFQSHHREELRQLSQPPPPSLISPKFTPPSTPSLNTTSFNERSAASYPVEDNPASSNTPELVKKLPEVTCTVRARIPTTTGQEMWLHVYKNDIDTKEHLAIVFGSTIRSKTLDAPRPGETEMDRMIRGAYQGRLHPGRTSSKLKNAGSGQASDAQVIQQAPLVRIHSECYTGETVWSARCDCGEQLDEAARLMALPSATGGVIIYLRQEGRGIGLGEKLKAYNLQDLGNDTYEANILLRHPADARSYGLATAMLQDLGLGGETGIRLLTNNPDKVRAVEGPGREVVVKERVAMVPLAWKTHGKSGINSDEVEKYLSTKVYF
ncbi:hypothetical protein EJ05DRAFT_397254 [Pseudovirgaria hyperparasitica]|uniref:GTP cyclohydrolase II n=1 Tax=Pseudovirgaria hyperparasitica TaxID=470096 RepID=A0A6A6W414_9PEZI|nr:uncharacterized protein EJ05DRAFT_397254 [Pseudovirgaria hyperparasitica]KAF2757678.1 hypothetical protein EJ05DRAFT_397254 [Pseudovirgaria hyperparasitica]